jgi:hypothetical protein
LTFDSLFVLLDLCPFETAEPPSGATPQFPGEPGAKGEHEIAPEAERLVFTVSRGVLPPGN